MFTVRNAHSISPLTAPAISWLSGVWGIAATWGFGPNRLLMAVSVTA